MYVRRVALRCRGTFALVCPLPLPILPAGAWSRLRDLGGIPRVSVRIIADANVLYWCQSSKQSRRGSCARCGTMMFFESTAAPGETHVTRACTPGAIDREPQCQTFLDQNVDWVTVDDGLPTLTSDDPLLAGYKEVGR